MADYDLLIVGAGISGLSMAQYAAGAGLRARVLEQERRVGGCLHSQRFSGALDGFWLELGAHSCFNSYGNLLALLERAQVLGQLRPRARVGFRLFAEGAVRGIPGQLHVLELLRAPWQLSRLRKAGLSVAEYYRAIVGPRNYAEVFGPAFDAVICQPAGDFPAESLFGKRARRKDVPRGFTLPGGLQTIADVLAAQPGIHIERECAVRTIRREGALFVLVTDHGDYSARHVCLATPVAVTATLLADAFPHLAGLLAEIATATVETVAVAVSRAQVRLPPLAGLIGRDEAFFSVVSRDTVPDSTYRGFTFHFRPGVLDEAGKLERISQVLGVPRMAFSADDVAFKRNLLPALRVGHGARVERIDRALAGTGLALAGNYFTGVAIEDCVTRARLEFARLQQEQGSGG